MVDSNSATLDGDVGLSFPAQIGLFTREDVRRDPSGAGVTVGYALSNATSPLIATLRVHRSPTSDSLLSFGGRSSAADAESSERELQASIVQIRHFYPDAVASDERPAFIVRGGVLQRGMEATVRYQYFISGQKQAAELAVETFCCVAGRWDYEYRFRYTPGQKDDFDKVQFTNSLPWSATSGTGDAVTN